VLEIVQSVRVGERLREVLDKVVEDGLLVRPGEGQRTALLFSHLLIASSVFVLGRTVRDTLFLSRYSLDALPWMFVAFGVASAITAVIYGRVAERMNHARAISTWCGLGVATYLATWGLVQTNVGWIYPVFYVWSEVFSNLAISQFWALANDLHDPRTAKRLFGTIGAARVLGVIVVGVLAGSIVHALGTEQLLFVVVGLLIAMAVLAQRTAREPRPSDAAKARTRRPTKAPATLVRDPYVLVLSAMLLSAFAALTVGDYQFKAIARATYTEDGLARFFSFFHAGTGIISFVFQLFVTPRLLRRYGVGVAMLVMPVTFGVASVLLIGAPSLFVACVMKFADNGLQYTIHDTTLQALYVPFQADVKRRARALLDAVVKPLAYALGGIIVIVLAKPLGPVWLSLASAVFVGAWLACVPSVRARYTQRLTNTLHVGGLGAFASEPVLDSTRRKALYGALGQTDPRFVLAALDELGSQLGPEAMAALTRLVHHRDPAIRVAALTRLAGLPAAELHEQDERAVVVALADPVPEVRGAAALALARLREDDAVPELSPLLDDSSDLVRSATLSGLLSHCGFEGAMVAGRRFAELLGSTDPEDREAAARALGGIGRTGARRLIPLLEDPEPNVRLAAAVAAHDVRDARLIPALIRQLGELRTRNACAGALAAIGRPALEPLMAVLDDPDKRRDVRLAVPRIVRRIRLPESYAMLRERAQDPDSFIRLAVFTALSKMRRNLRLRAEPLDTVRSWVDREIRETLRLGMHYAAVRDQIGTPLLDEAVQVSQARGSRRVLRILELRYAGEPIRMVKDRIDDPARRANALEVLDAELEPVLRGVVMPFLDDEDIADKARRYGISVATSGDDVLESRLANANPYTVLVALDAARVHKRPLAVPAARRLATHKSALVREGALLALAELDRGHCQAVLEQATHDADARVARFARQLLCKLGHLKATEEPMLMLSTVEKLLVLRATPMFAKLRGDDLAPLAHVAEVESYAAGETIFDEGEPGDALFVVVRGLVGITKGEKRLARLGVNETFGEMSVLDEAPRSACARALEDSELLRIGSEEFAEVLHEQVEIAEGVIRVLSRRLRETNALLERGVDVTGRTEQS
jgi:ATP/ADP translocase/HEAT repeat protein